jgi:predicted transposase YdaD
VFNDFLRETPVYQEVFEEGLEQGLERGRLQGLQQGHEEALQQALHQQREALLDIVRERFPKIVRPVSKLIEAIEDPAILLRLIVKMSTVQTAEEAKQLLFDATVDEES